MSFRPESKWFAFVVLMAFLVASIAIHFNRSRRIRQLREMNKQTEDQLFEAAQKQLQPEEKAAEKSSK